MRIAWLMSLGLSSVFARGWRGDEESGRVSFKGWGTLVQCLAFLSFPRKLGSMADGSNGSAMPRDPIEGLERMWGNRPNAALDLLAVRPLMSWSEKKQNWRRVWSWLLEGRMEWRKAWRARDSAAQISSTHSRERPGEVGEFVSGVGHPSALSSLIAPSAGDKVRRSPPTITHRSGTKAK